MTAAIYEVWSLASDSVLMAYPTEDEALQLVRANYEAGGIQAIQTLMIVRERRGQSKVIWNGDELAAWLASVDTPGYASGRAG